MKIGIVWPYHIFKPGGVLEHVMHQADGLRQRGHDVTIITPRPRGYDMSDAPKGVVFIGGSARIKTPSSTSSDVSITIDVDAVAAARPPNIATSDLSTCRHVPCCTSRECHRPVADSIIPRVF